MNGINDGRAITFETLHFLFRPKLQSLAEGIIGGLSDEADEAVQATFVYVLENPHLVPAESIAIERWLVRVLKFAVRKVRARRHRHEYRAIAPKPRSTSRSKCTPITSADETTEHDMAVAAAAVPLDVQDERYKVLDDLTLRERNLLFESTNSRHCSWDRRIRQAELRAKLKLKVGGSRLPTAETRALEFVRYHAELRGLAIRDYLSSFRMLERRVGKCLKLRDLNLDFYNRFVSPLSRSSRKRILAVWNAAARMSIVERLPNSSGQTQAPHPIHWSEFEINKVIGVTERMKGVVVRSRIPKSKFWPAIICLAADLGTPFSYLMQLTWSELRADDAFSQKASPRTIEFVKRLERYGYRHVFPWQGAEMRFYKYYGRLIREGGLTLLRLTPREWDVLFGTAEGQSETKLAENLNCCVGVIRKYRQRIREKLGIRGTWSIRLLVTAARERGLLQVTSHQNYSPLRRD